MCIRDSNKINGIGTKTAKLFRKKNINTIFDLLWNLPRDIIDRSDLRKINQLQIGKIQTISVNVRKYNFPRIRNLPNRVLCEDETGKLDCIFFNSYEGYIRKILPLNSKVIDILYLAVPGEYSAFIKATLPLTYPPERVGLINLTLSRP